jgi:hypothetical protein
MLSPYFKKQQYIEYYNDVTKDKDGYKEYRKNVHEKWYQKNKEELSNGYYLSKLEKELLENPEWVINLIKRIFEEL